LGAGVVDRLRELGLPVRGVNVGEAAAVSDRYMRLRDELWFSARDWLAGADVKLPPDDALIGELTGPKYKITSTGKIQVERRTT
jgi:phage terminase large subunit